MPVNPAIIRKFLENSSPTQLEKIGTKKLLKVFRRAASKVPAYKDILEKNNVNVNEIKTVEDFLQKAPILTKEATFGRYEIDQLCIDGNIDGITSAITSSGLSGVFSYGIITRDSEKNIARIADLIINYYLNTTKDELAIINGLAMGVQIPSKYTVITASVRSDMIISFIRLLQKKYKKFLIFADPNFTKKILEDGLEAGLDWKSINVSFAIGGDWFSNSMTNYFAHLAGIEFNKPENGQILSNFGITEVALTIFFSSVSCFRIRNAAQQDEKLKKALFGDLNFCPELLHYAPNRSFIETTNNDKNDFGELVFTMLDEKNKMPLIRYNSKDIGKLISYQCLVKILTELGYESLIPKVRLPLAAIYGRQGSWLATKEGRILPQEIKEALYRNFDVASSITGYFRLSKKKDKPLLEIQLNKKIKKDKKLLLKIQKSIKDIIAQDIEIKIYEHYLSPYGMELDYESKFRCV